MPFRSSLPHLLSVLRRHRRRLALGLAAAAGLGLVLAFLYGFTCGFAGCPSVEEIRAFRPSEGGRVLDREGELLGRLRPVRRVVVPLERIPPHVRQAFVAVEDRRFREHGGIDWRSVGRALWRNLVSLGVREGSSTITMQVARSAFIGDHDGRVSLGRKLIELRLAPRIERALSKDRILELYLNLIYLGDGTYGVEAASRHWFGKSVSRLTLAEGATLAALPKAPTVYEPRRHAERARARRNLVLALMAREGFVSGERARAAARQPLRVRSRGWRPATGWSYAVELARAFVDSALGRDAGRGELTVRTTFDARAQRAAEQAVRDRAAAIGRGVQGAMVALDPGSGEMLAVVGGSGPAAGGFNRALAARRQPGSAFKPFVYAAAIEAGLTTVTPVDDSPVEVVDAGRVWRPANHDHEYGGTIPLRLALARSANAATVRVSQWVGPGRVAALARRLGIASPIRPLPSIALGAVEVTPLELVAAYAPLANGGFRVEPHFVRSVEAGGRTLWQGNPKPPAPVLDPRDAFLVTSMLQSAVDEGTGYVLRELGVHDPVAGKTGTTNNGADVWFVGYTPSLVAGFWFGRDTPRSLGGGASGARLAAPAWASFYRKAWRDRGAGEGWRAPAGVVERVVDPETGLLAGDYCPTRRLEWFKAGTEPTEHCREHDSPVVEFFEDLGQAIGEAIGDLFDDD
ncbi:MAG TPA: PBP1A family penicillin-binding protein [Gemmatimonadales bacterium]|nr:PBP1A family penicillin-binding protein [Gemmatimonadales bacterium]